VRVIGPVHAVGHESPERNVGRGTCGPRPTGAPASAGAECAGCVEIQFQPSMLWTISK